MLVTLRDQRVDSQELLWMVIISFILKTLLCDSGVMV